MSSDQGEGAEGKERDGFEHAVLGIERENKSGGGGVLTLSVLEVGLRGVCREMER